MPLAVVSAGAFVTVSTFLGSGAISFSENMKPSNVTDELLNLNFLLSVKLPHANLQHTASRAASWSACVFQNDHIIVDVERSRNISELVF